MKQRLITAAVLLCILVPVLIFSDTLFFPVIAAVFCFIAVWEMQHCLGCHKKYAVSIPSYLMAIGLPLGLFLVGGLDGIRVRPFPVYNRALYLLAFAAAFAVYMFYLFAAAVFCRRALSFSEIASSYMTTFYITLAFTAIPFIRYGAHGEYYFLLCFLGAWVTDSFAYFVGYLFGRHKLIPEISPKKTVEGSIGGSVGGVLAFLLFGFFAGKETGQTPNYAVLAGLGFLVSILAQIGDLIASLIKREHEIKDYGKIFPGHGGVMDRFDSVIATTPLLLIVCTLDSLLSYNLLL